MSDVPDPIDERMGTKPPPCNIEAEHALIGTLLYDNRSAERLPDTLLEGHFYEPFHGRLFAAMMDLIGRGELADPIVLMDKFRGDPAWKDVGELRFLADLVDYAPPSANIGDYAKVIYDLALRRELMRLGRSITNCAENDMEASGIEQVGYAETALFSLAETGGAQKGLKEFAGPLASVLESAAEAYQREGKLVGVSTGLMDLDKKLGGLHDTDLIILAARPSMGKTSLATNIAFSAARTYSFTVDQHTEIKRTDSGGVVAFFSLEMSEDQLARRILADVSGIQATRMEQGDFDQAEFARMTDAAKEIAGCPLYMDATGGISIAALTTRARRLKRMVGLDLVIVDYLQLVSVDGNDRMSPQERVSKITAGLKQMAKDLGVPVLALSQLSRQVENRDDKRPQLSDLRDSGSIEQDADVVMFLYREAYYLERSIPKEGSPEHLKWEEDLDKLRNVAEIIIAKQRHGPIGMVKVAWNGELTKFGNIARPGIDFSQARS